jgi:seipin
MYKYRIISFITLTGAFWTVEMIFAALVWFALSVFIFPQQLSPIKTEESPKVKQERAEDEDEHVLSDTPRTFPTLSGQPPLRYSSPRVKTEEEEESSLLETHPVTAEADDEDEDADFLLEESPAINRGVSDSGIGTSMDSSAGRHDTVRRRLSRN